MRLIYIRPMKEIRTVVASCSLHAIAERYDYRFGRDMFTPTRSGWITVKRHRFKDHPIAGPPQNALKVMLVYQRSIRLRRWSPMSTTRSQGERDRVGER